MITIEVNIEDGVSEYLAELISALTGQQAVELNEQGGIAARNAAIAYHREFDQAGGWRGKRYLGASQNDGSDFGSDVARGWSLESFDRDGAVISNDASHYAFKVTGGTITPKRAKALTIPMVPEARGVRASVYVQNTGRKLFTIKGKKALFEAKEGGGVRAIYALLERVTMGPWAGALPPEEVIADAYTAAYRDGLTEILEGS